MCEERLSRVQTAACGSVCVCVRSTACRVPYWPATDERGDGGREMQRREFLRWMMGLEGVCKWSAAPAPTVFLLQNTHRDTGTQTHLQTNICSDCRATTLCLNRQRASSFAGLVPFKTKPGHVRPLLLSRRTNRTYRTRHRSAVDSRSGPRT